MSPARGQRLAHGPWILGHRGAPREAPENTLAALELALAIGADGVEYDVRACASGELCVLHDETLERTTGEAAALAALTLPELDRVDAGSWFGAEFAGERLPLVDEALTLRRPQDGGRPLQMIELKEAGLVPRLAELLEASADPPPVRVASFLKSAVLDARDHGLAAMYLAPSPTADVHAFVRDERLPALGLPPGGWRGVDEPWPCERWEWSVDEPDDLLAACARPLFGFNTNEPRRALAVRRLVRLVGRPLETYPLQVEPLVVEPRQGLAASEGEWCGTWDVTARIANPFDEPVRARADLRVRGGAYEVRGLPATLELGPRESAPVRFELTGGSWSPGRDPRIEVAFERSPVGGDVPEEDDRRIVLDATLARIREAVLDGPPRRLTMLRETRGAAPASMTVERRPGLLTCAIEHAGGLDDARAVMHLEGEVHVGGRSVRLPLPDAPPDRPLRFSCGMRGRQGGRTVLRRWAGGLGDGPLAGGPGRLWVRARG